MSVLLAAVLLTSCGDGIGGWFGKPPGVEFSPKGLSFEADEGGADPAAQTLSIEVVAFDDGAWTASTTEPWLTVSPVAGKGDSTLEVSVSIAALTEGAYTAQLIIDCPGTGLGPFSLSVTLSVGPAAPGSVWYAKVGGTGGGTSWANAFGHPQDAVDAASSGEEVWVAEGTYTRQGSDTVLLTMKDGVAIYGGFAGTETSRDQRDHASHVTTLDGEDVVYHVVVGASDAVFDGSTVTRGNANGVNPDDQGAGMYNNSVSSLTIANCEFSQNVAASTGGGMTNVGSSLTVTNCVFSWNSANSAGGMHNSLSSPAVDGCTFSDNTASTFLGGGMYNSSSSSPAVINCLFTGNAAPNDSGGAMANHITCSPTVTNCTFSGNSAGNKGGGISITNNSTATLTNCILWGNRASSDPEIRADATSSCPATHSDVRGGYAGTGNIDADPLFVNAGAGDLHLQAGSPCIDTGTILGAPGTDLDGVLRPQGGGVDMGAYERAAANVWYVDATRPDDSGAGDSWATAKKTVQAANALAGAGDEIWIADGTYTNNGGGTATVLQMQDGVGYYGGFQGNETVRTDRDPGTYVTTFDGEDSACHVVEGANNATLDGFTVTGGHASGAFPDDRGGGLYTESVTNLTVAGCIFTNNVTDASGGGMANYYGSSPTVTNCTFSGNSAIGSGGGMYNYQSSPTVSKCKFSGNTAGYGGAMGNGENAAIMANCAFWNNSSDYGGVSSNWTSSAVWTNCTFSGNTATTSGGGMYNYGSSSPTVTNCILWSNTAPAGPEIFSEAGNSCTVEYSDIDQVGGFTDAGGNIDADPLFVDPDGADDVPGTADDDFRLSPGSPCIDAADGDAAPDEDIEGNARHDDPGTTDTGTGAITYADMGAYEFQGTTWTYKVVDLTTGGMTGHLSIPDLETNADYKTTKLVLRLVRSGTFQMGDQIGGHDPDELPVHTVNITEPFYMGVFEVTQAQWETIMGAKTFGFEGFDHRPAETVSWNDSQDFLAQLSASSGENCRLPTEAEWEYTCRAGTSTHLSYGDTADGNWMWYNVNSGGATHDVASTANKPNPWGFYDMHGNVWEWCSDWYDSGYYSVSPANDPQGPSSGSTRVSRGCSWTNTGTDTYSAQRYSYGPTVVYDNLGFRAVLVP